MYGNPEDLTREMDRDRACEDHKTVEFEGGGGGLENEDDDDELDGVSRDALVLPETKLEHWRCIFGGQNSHHVTQYSCDPEPVKNDTGYMTGEYSLESFESFVSLLPPELAHTGSTSGPFTGLADRPTRKRDFEKYSERLNSFYQDPKSWSRTHPSAERLAEVGFYYLGYEGAVECHKCGARIISWEGDLDPLFRHYSKNPNCPFLELNFAGEVWRLTTSQAAQNYTEKYANSSARLHSFAQWPLGALVTSYQLASVGFYYTGTGTRVRCFSCGLMYDDWRSGDVPLLIHRKHSPLCRYLSTLLTAGPSVPPPLPPPSGPPLPHPSRPDWANEYTRLKSFKYLPKTVPVAREECARAGLYFLRKPDVMKCFSCDAVVKDWVDGDVPEEKHREANPDCKFLREFFPNKLDRRASESSEEGIDPSTLPEPQYSVADLEMLSKKFESGYETEFTRLSLADRPPLHSQYHDTYPSSEYGRPPSQHDSGAYSGTGGQPSHESSYASLQSTYSTSQKAVRSYDSAYGSVHVHSSDLELPSASQRRQDEYIPSPLASFNVPPQHMFPPGRSSVASGIMDRPIHLPPSYYYQAPYNPPQYGSQETLYMVR